MANIAPQFEADSVSRKASAQVKQGKAPAYSNTRAAESAPPTSNRRRKSQTSQARGNQRENDPPKAGKASASVDSRGFIQLLGNRPDKLDHQKDKNACPKNCGTTIGLKEFSQSNFANIIYCGIINTS